MNGGIGSGRGGSWPFSIAFHVGHLFPGWRYKRLLLRCNLWRWNNLRMVQVAWEWLHWEGYLQIRIPGYWPYEREGGMRVLLEMQRETASGIGTVGVEGSQ
jgi:hypothetical protein